MVSFFNTQKRNISCWEPMTWQAYQIVSYVILFTALQGKYVPFLIWANWGSEKLGNFSNVTQLVCSIWKPTGFWVLYLPFFSDQKPCRDTWLAVKWSFWNTLKIHWALEVISEHPFQNKSGQLICFPDLIFPQCVFL